MKGIGKLIGLGIVVVVFALGLKDAAETRANQAPEGIEEHCRALSEEEFGQYMQAMEIGNFETVEQFDKRCKP